MVVLMPAASETSIYIACLLPYYIYVGLNNINGKIYVDQTAAGFKWKYI